MSEIAPEIDLYYMNLAAGMADPVDVHPDTLGLEALRAHSRSEFRSPAKSSLYDLALRTPGTAYSASNGENLLQRNYAEYEHAHEQALDVREDLIEKRATRAPELEEAICTVVSQDEHLFNEYIKWVTRNCDDLITERNVHTKWLLSHVTAPNQVGKTFFDFLRVNHRFTQQLQNDPITLDIIRSSKQEWQERTAELVDTKVLHPSVLKRNKRLADTRVYIGDDFSTAASGNAGYAPFVGNAVVIGRWALVSDSDEALTIIPHELGHKHAWGGNIKDRIAGRGMTLDRSVLDEPLVQHLAEVVTLDIDPDEITSTVQIYPSLKDLFGTVVDMAVNRGADVSVSKFLYAFSATGVLRHTLQDRLDLEIAGALQLGSRPLESVCEEVYRVALLEQKSSPDLTKMDSLEEAASVVSNALTRRKGSLPSNWN